MHNIDMDSIVEYAIEKVKAEITGMRGSKIKDVDIDDINYNGNRISFQVIGYNAAAKPVSEDYFFCSINFEDAPAESEDDVKWLIDNNVPEFAYNFVKHPIKPSMREELKYKNNYDTCGSCGAVVDGNDITIENWEGRWVRYTCPNCGNEFDRSMYGVVDESIQESYNVQYYQIFSNPEKPTDNGKMIAQAGTEEEAKAKGNELVGKGNYLIKAVCDDGKVRDVDLHDYFNKSKDLKEYYRGEDALDDVISWLQDHEQAWNDFTAHFSDVEDEDLTYDMVIDWISEHETLYDDYLGFFGDEESDYSESLEGMHTYNVTFYMDSLDDNVMSGPSTTKKIMASSKEEAEKKLRDECTDKYYIPTITDVELVEEVIRETLAPGDRVYVTVSNRQGHVLKLIGNDLVEVELDGNWLYPARIDTFYRNEVELIDMSPEFDDEFDDEEDIDPDAVIDSLKEESAEYVAKPSALSRDDMIEHLLDAEDEHEFIFAECDKMIRKYKIEANPDWDLDDILETFTTNQLEELLQKVMNKVQLEEDLGQTVGVALFCTASIEVCTVGGVDEDGEDVEEPTIFDDKTPVNDILNAIDPDTDEGDAKCAEINKLLNAMPDGYIQVQAYCRGRDMGDRQVYDAYELYDELRDIFNLDESLNESNNAYTYRGHYIINDGSTWMIKDGNNQVIRSGIATDAEAEEIIDDLDESVDYEDAFVADDDM